MKCTTIGTMITISKMITAATRQNLIFMSFNHICFLTLFAPLLKPWALTAKLSALSSMESSLSPLHKAVSTLLSQELTKTKKKTAGHTYRSITLLMLSLMIPTVSSISCNDLLVQRFRLTHADARNSPMTVTYRLQSSSLGVTTRLGSLRWDVWVVWHAGGHRVRVCVL